MNIKDVLYKTPEMTEEKLLELISSNSFYLGFELINRIKKLHRVPIQNGILKEWDLIQDKKSYLTKSQRDKICGLVSVCLIKMTNGGGEERTSTSTDPVETI